MRIFDYPLIVLVARQSLLPSGVECLLNEYGFTPQDWRRDPTDNDNEGVAELMGRLCYGSFGPRQGRIGARDYMSHILSSGHGSILEHAVWSFVICRVSRAFTHQMVRQRVGISPSQESQHFIHYSELDAEPGTQPAAICATGLEGEARELYLKGVQESVERYNALWRQLKAEHPDWDKKTICERARLVLPAGVESRLGITANARALRHFCEMRGTKHNTLEIRCVAVEMAKLMKIEAPSMFEDLRIFTEADGYLAISSQYSKV